METLESRVDVYKCNEDKKSPFHQKNKQQIQIKTIILMNMMAHIELIWGFHDIN